jgi:adenylate kinase family enzyme
MNAYIFYGKSGSGKGTQAQLLIEHLENQGQSVLYVETGKLFRDFVASNDTFSAQRTKSIIDNGQLMPAFFPVYLWAKQLIENYDGTQHIILDGVTRRIEEAPILESALEFLQVDKKIVFNIDLSNASAQQRLLSRNQGRADDADVTKIQQRLDWYAENVNPVLDYYRQGNTLTVYDINGEPAIETIFEEIKKCI